MGLELAVPSTRSALQAPARRLVLAPRGSVEPFPGVERAIELARARRRFALIVPTKPALEHVKNEVARRAGAVDPFAFYTVLGLAKRVLGARTPRLATPRERDLLLERALGALGHESTGGIANELRRASRFRG